MNNQVFNSAKISVEYVNILALKFILKGIIISTYEFMSKSFNL